jgi:hypothetical protein
MYSWIAADVHVGGPMCCRSTRELFRLNQREPSPGGNLEALVKLGFQHVGYWRLEAGTLRLELTNLQPAPRVLYAFLSDGQLKYIGQSKKTLAARLAGYRNPQPSQRTNVRVNEKLIGLLSTGVVVDIYGFVDNGLWSYGGFHLNVAAGLEDSLVATLRPEWNLVGMSVKLHSTEASPVATHIPPAEPTTASRSVDPDSSSPHLAERIREHVHRTYIEPALRAGKSSVTVRAGDVHREMGFTSRYPAVCQALDTRLFLAKYDLTLVSRKGSEQGANVYFTYALPGGGNP